MFASTDAAVGYAGHIVGEVEVAAVEEDGGGTHGTADDFPVGEAELFPLGDEEYGIGIEDCVVDACAVGDAVTNAAAAFVHRDRVVGADCAAGAEEAVYEDEGGRFAHIVGLGLEGEPPKGNLAPGYIAVKMAREFLEEYVLLTFVDLLDGIEYAHIVAVLRCGLNQCLNVFGEA